MSEALLSVRDALISFKTPGGSIRALDGVSIEVNVGETVAVVGESGCGKTTLAVAILGLEKLASGTIRFQGKEHNRMPRDLAAKIGIVWQDPFASIDPRWQIGRILAEPGVLLNRPIDVPSLLTEVGLDPSMAERYPHQLSGGERQRVAIGRALALRPPLVICDEPTAALDLSIQAQILNLLRELQAERGCAFLYISHDLLTVRYLADRMAVMYMGRIVEFGRTEQVFNSPMHPYTKALLDSAPTLERLGELPDIAEGEVPDPTIKIVGCRFAGRCPNVQDVCRVGEPKLVDNGGHIAYCNFPNLLITDREPTNASG